MAGDLIEGRQTYSYCSKRERGERGLAVTDEFPDGVGIFETIRTLNGKPAFLSAHLSRAVKSAKALSIKVATEKKIAAMIERVLLDNPIHTEVGRLRIEFHSSGQLRVDILPASMVLRTASSTSGWP